MKKTVVASLVSVLIFVVALGLAASYIGWQFISSPSSNEDKPIVYEVVPGKGFESIAKDLETLNVVKNARAFSVYARVTGYRTKLKTGEYALNTHMKPQEVIAVLISGKSIARPFTVAEGLNIFDIAQLYESQGFGSATEFTMLAFDPTFATFLVGEQVPSLEGYLYPETYQITKFTTTRELIAAMVQRFQLVWKEIAKKVPADYFLKKHEIVTLASIVEKETGAAQERPIVSSVFHNRFKKNMRLQTDPTIIYGMALDARAMPSNITKADLLRPHPYNSYLNYGLPPGPISNPGKHALWAAIFPAKTDYLYFVSQNNGTHVFSATYGEHSNAVRKFQLDPKARAGHSWREGGKPTNAEEPMKEVVKPTVTKTVTQEKVTTKTVQEKPVKAGAEKAVAKTTTTTASTETKKTTVTKPATEKKDAGSKPASSEKSPGTKPVSK